MRSINRGFTIIELLVVVAVIGILATITLIGFNRYQANTRDTERSSQATIITEALERYYDKNGEYPSCSTMTNPTGTNVINNALTGTDPKVLVTPQAATNKTNSIDICTTLTAGSTTDSFAYVGDGSSVCSTGNACLSYTFQYKEEATNTIKSIKSRRSTSILTSGDITNLTATTYSFSQVNLAWGAIGGASSYNVQWHLNTNDFTTPTGTKTATGSSTPVTGLSLGSLYFFRIQPVAGTETGNWSNIASATTYTLDTPSATAVPDPAAPNSQIKVTWGNVTNATSYSLQYSSSSAVNGTTGDFTTSPTTLTTSSPYTLSGLGTGVTRYFHVKAVASGFTSGWSATTSATTSVPAPTAPTIAWTNDLGSTTTPAVSCSLGTPQYSRATTYRTDGSIAENYGAWSAWQTSPDFNVDFITGQGQFGIAKVRAECIYGGVESDPVESDPIKKIRPITTIGASTSIVQTTSPAKIAVYGSCASGMTDIYIYGQIYHGSAGTHSGGGWGAGSGFQITNGTPNYSYNDGLNAYRVSRTICRTSYWDRSTYSAVPGGTLQGSGLTAYNNFVNAGYNYSSARISI